MLLGVHTQLKVFGTTVCLPGEFFDDSKAETTPDPTSYVTRLKSVMKVLQATPIHKQQWCTLKSCTYIFICHNAVRKPLQKLYDGPYKVIKHSDKHYTCDVSGQLKLLQLTVLSQIFMNRSTHIFPSRCHYKGRFATDQKAIFSNSFWSSNMLA